MAHVDQVLLLLSFLQNRNQSPSAQFHIDQSRQCAKDGNFPDCAQHLHALLNEKSCSDQASVRLALAEVCLITKSYEDALHYVHVEAALFESLGKDQQCRCEELKVEALVESALLSRDGSEPNPKEATVVILPQYAMESFSLAQTLTKGRQLPESFYDPFLDALMANRREMALANKRNMQTLPPPFEFFRTNDEFRSVVRSRRKEWYVALLGEFPFEYGLEIETRALHSFLEPFRTEPNKQEAQAEEEESKSECSTASESEDEESEDEEMEPKKDLEVEQLLLQSLESYLQLFLPHEHIFLEINKFLELPKDVNSEEVSNMLVVARAIVPREIPRCATAADLKAYEMNEKKAESLDDYTLLLSAAIILKQHGVAKRLFAELSERQGFFDMSVLLSVNDTGYSPLTNVLNRGDVEFLNMMREFIKSASAKSLTKARKMHDEDLRTVLFLLTQPTFDVKDLKPCTLLSDFLKPLFWDLAAVLEHFRMLGLTPEGNVREGCEDYLGLQTHEEYLELLHKSDEDEQRKTGKKGAEEDYGWGYNAGYTEGYKKGYDQGEWGKGGDHSEEGHYEEFYEEGYAHGYRDGIPHGVHNRKRDEEQRRRRREEASERNRQETRRRPPRGHKRQREESKCNEQRRGRYEHRRHHRQEGSKEQSHRGEHRRHNQNRREYNDSQKTKSRFSRVNFNC